MQHGRKHAATQGNSRMVKSHGTGGGEMVVSQNSGYLFYDRHNEDYSNLGSILGSPDFGKVPNSDLTPTMENEMDTGIKMCLMGLGWWAWFTYQDGVLL